MVLTHTPRPQRPAAPLVMFPSSPLALCRGRSWSPCPIIRRTDRDQGAGTRDVLHLFYLLNRIGPPPQFLLTRYSSQHPSQREAAGDRAAPIPLHAGGEQLSQEGFLQVSEVLLLCSILKIHDIFSHLENLLPKLIAYFRAMEDICAAPYILAQFGLL